MGDIDPVLIVPRGSPSGDDPPRARMTRIGAAIAERPIAVVALTMLPMLTALLGVPLCDDVAWQLWIAHHIRLGARLYVDIREVNPPLWFWMAVPVDAAADALQIASGRLLVLLVALITVASLAATERLVRHIPTGRRTALLVFAALVLLILPRWMTGQREQLMLIGALPYVALAATRRTARPAPLWLAFAIGIGAAAGFALKHYFLVTPVLLEIWLILGLRRAWRPLRVETLTLAIAGAAYLATILLATPDFLRSIVPLVRLSYDGVGSQSLSALFQPQQCFWVLGALALALEHRRIGRATPFAVALLIATIGFAAAWAIQHKGWAYQSVATSGGLAIAIAALIAEDGRMPNPLTPTILLVPLLFGWNSEMFDADYRDALRPLAAETRPGESVGLVTLDPAISWPFVAERQLRYPNRYYSFWILNAVVRHERGDRDPRLAALGRTVVRETAIDYRCAAPDRIVFTPPRTGAGFDIRAFFLRDPAFRDLMTHYRRAWRTADLDVFRQVSALPPIARGTCRRGV